MADFKTVHLSFNLANRLVGAAGGDSSECNPGGSTICWSPTKGCGAAAMTCVGTSSKFESLEAMVSLPAPEFENFQREMNALIAKFTKQK